MIKPIQKIIALCLASTITFAPTFIFGLEATRPFGGISEIVVSIQNGAEIPQNSDNIALYLNGSVISGRGIYSFTNKQDHINISLDNTSLYSNTGLMYALLIGPDADAFELLCGNDANVTGNVLPSLSESSLSRHLGAKRISNVNGGYLRLNALQIRPIDGLVPRDEPYTASFIILSDDYRLGTFASFDVQFSVAPTSGTQGTTELRFVIGQNTFTRNGLPQTLDIAPYIDDAVGRTMMPIRVISTELGADVKWDEATRSISIIKDSISINLMLDEDLPNGLGRPVIINGRTFVPLAYVSNILGVETRWDSTTRAVYMTFIAH